MLDFDPITTGSFDVGFYALADVFVACEVNPLWWCGVLRGIDGARGVAVCNHVKGRLSKTPRSTAWSLAGEMSRGMSHPFIRTVT